MANTVTFSVGGSGGGGVIKSIQHIVFRADNYQEIDGFAEGSGTTPMTKIYQISINLDHDVDPDKTIVIYQSDIYMRAYSQPGLGGFTALTKDFIVLSKITENSINFITSSTNTSIFSNEIPDQIIQVIEFA